MAFPWLCRSASGSAALLDRCYPCGALTQSFATRTIATWVDNRVATAGRTARRITVFHLEEEPLAPSIKPGNELATEYWTASDNTGRAAQRAWLVMSP
jgi:hypothetical protein